MATISGGDKLEAALRDMAQKVTNPGTLSVGFQDGSTDETGTSNAMKAALNEFGTGRSIVSEGGVTVMQHIPPRPFFRTMVANKSLSWADDIATLLQAHKYDATEVLKLMGEKIQGQLVDSIFNGGWTPNAPSTLRRKSGSQPLVDTGAMANSVTWVIK